MQGVWWCDGVQGGMMGCRSGVMGSRGGVMNRDFKTHAGIVNNFCSLTRRFEIQVQTRLKASNLKVALIYYLYFKFC